MKQVFYSEILNKYFDTREAAEKAEAEYNHQLAVMKANEEKKKQELALQKQQRADEAKKVEEAFKIAEEANKAARKALSDFCAKYGTFHKTYSDNDAQPFSSIFDWFFN
jgi:predicted  nucleic acid-binding Zn-ribbon protein